MLNIKDIAASRELNAAEMTKVKGGATPGLSLFSPVSIPSFSTSVAETNAIGGAATNVNSLVNGGINTADFGSGIVAPVVQSSTQTNDNDVAQLAAQIGIQSSF